VGKRRCAEKQCQTITKNWDVGFWTREEKSIRKHVGFYRQMRYSSCWLYFFVNTITHFAIGVPWAMNELIAEFLFEPHALKKVNDKRLNWSKFISRLINFDVPASFKIEIDVFFTVFDWLAQLQLWNCESVGSCLWVTPAGNYSYKLLTFIDRVIITGLLAKTSAWSIIKVVYLWLGFLNQIMVLHNRWCWAYGASVFFILQRIRNIENQDIKQIMLCTLYSLQFGC
jgi:hypothetical protein